MPFVLPALLLGVTLNPQYAREYAAFSTALQASLLDNYNAKVPPVTSRRSEQSVALSDAGTDVSVQIRVFKVDSVDAAHGKMGLKVWFRQNWKDERLVWNESSFGGISMIFVGDFDQLQPIDDVSMCDDETSYATCPKSLWRVCGGGAHRGARAPRPPFHPQAPRCARLFLGVVAGWRFLREARCG